MRTIDITQVLSPDLKSRVRVHDLKLFIENSGDKEIVLDFSHVKFATRSFMDEFYNVFMKDVEANPFMVTLASIPEDINLILESVSKTQTKAKVIQTTTRTTSFSSLEEAIHFLKSFAL